jgi:hypothetical protein
MNAKFNELIQEAMTLLDSAIDEIDGNLSESKEYAQLTTMLDALEYMSTH